MAVNRLKESFDIFLLANPKADKTQLIKFINTFIETEQTEYKTNTDSGKLTFGKYRGLTVDQVLSLPKGDTYLKWMVRQTWFEEDKFPSLYQTCVEKGVIDA